MPSGLSPEKLSFEGRSPVMKRQYVLVLNNRIPFTRNIMNKSKSENLLVKSAGSTWIEIRFDWEKCRINGPLP